MLRRSLLVVPLITVAAGGLGTVLETRPFVVVTLAAAIGLGGQLWLAQTSERRLGQVADRVSAFAEGETTQPATTDIDGSREWQRLGAALDRVGTSMQARFDDLASERARVQRLLDSMATAVLLFGGDHLAYANPIARELFGVTGDAASTPLQVLGARGLADAVAEAAETAAPVAVEVRVNDRDLLGRASVTSAGEVALVIVDLTESRRIDAIRRDFVTNASHELKTPVAGIQALSDSLGLALERDPDRARSMTRRLSHEAERLGNLVRELLDLARLEDQASALGRRRVDVVQITLDQIDRLAGLAASRDVDVHLVGDPDDPVVLVAVPEDVRLLVGNLIENAVQYNRPHGEVTIAARRGGAEVVIEVTDTGIGIPDSERDRIFERFYRVDRARSRAVGGTGLGLAIVRHTVQRYGGEILVRSTLGEGTTFRVVLPVDGEARAGSTDASARRHGGRDLPPTITT